MLEWLAEWRYNNRHFTIIAINNEGKELNDYRIRKFQLHKCFDAFISSCEVGMRKPDPEIFRLGLGIAQVAPEQSVYFDDRVMLSEAAGKLGIHAYHHQGFESTKKMLEEIKRGKIPG
jgi:putative hydrolase of the HAD superfamily